MKHCELKALAGYLEKYSYISRIKRIENNMIEIIFDEQSDRAVIMDMTRSASTVYIAVSSSPSQIYKAPFDKLLQQLFRHSKIISVEVPNRDRVLRLKVSPPSRYLKRELLLQFEFTGRHTNAIIVDENNRVIDALHHIDADRSYRVVKPGAELLPLPGRDSNTNGGSAISSAEIVNILEQNHTIATERLLKSKKKQKMGVVKKKIDKIKKMLKELPDSDTLLEKESEYRNIANIILSNLHRIKTYDKKLLTKDFKGETIEILFPKNILKNRLSEYYFNLARKAHAKSVRMHIEKENLESKLFFYKNILNSIEISDNPEEIEMLLPKKGASLKKKEKLRKGELYWIDGYKVFVGRNSSENQYLLENAKANDVWMHIQNMPSSHVIIRTDKQNLPDSVLRSAAKLCVDTSVQYGGDYNVDYTKRKFVKIQEGSRVEYDKYSTIRVRKEGTEKRE